MTFSNLAILAALLASGPAWATAPMSPASLSPVAQAEIEPEIEDDSEALTTTAALDLNQAETRLLAKITESINPEADSIFFNLEENAAAEKPGIGVNEVNAIALYAELAKRAIAEEAAARQALSLAILRGDTRAKAAKNEAFENRIAESLIKRFDNGDKGAKDELMKQALKGNKKARTYLGLDKPIAVSIPETVSPTAKATEVPAKELKP